MRRPGFTLIELLVVIAIIAILAALIVGATMRVIGVQAQKNSMLLVQKVSDALNAQWNATVEEAYREPIPPAVIAGAGGNMMQARQTYINLRLAQQFPQTYAEAIGGPGFGIQPDPFYAKWLGGNPNPNDPQQTGVLLWLMLKNSRNGAIFNQDIFTPREAVPSSIPNVFCLIDDWKAPLQFQRAPYAQVFPNQANNAAIPFDLNVNNYFVPLIWSNGGPSGVPIYSNQVTIGGFTGG